MPIKLNNETYYTAKEVSLKFFISMETVRDWRKNKGLNGHLIGKRKYFYSEYALDKFIKGETNGNEQ